MDAKIIAFPGGRSVEVIPPTTEDMPDFDAWCEANLPALINEVDMLDGYWSAGDRPAFRDQLKAVGQMVTAMTPPEGG